MEKTLGNLIDELTIVNLKIWHLEDLKRDEANNDAVVADATRKTNSLNQQRNDLIQAIDQLVLGLVSGTKTMKDYKQGNTKVYGKHIPKSWAPR